MNFRFAVVAVIYIFMAANLFAQDDKRVKVFGNVRDAEGHPIELVHVSAKGTIFGAVTNANGYRSEERRVGKECRSRWSPYH